MATSTVTPQAAGGALGIAGFEVNTTQGGGPPGYEPEPYGFDQAGGHPFSLTTTVRFTTQPAPGVEGPLPTGDAKDVLIDLPPGLSADPLAVPRCATPEGQACPASAQVGVFVLRVQFNGHPLRLLGPLVNLRAGPGEAARLGLETPLGRYLLSGRLVREPEGYALAIDASGLPALGVSEIQTTLWGVPAAPAHDAERGLICLRGEGTGSWLCPVAGNQPSGIEEVPFLALPGRCPGEPMAPSAWVDSWEQPGSYAHATATMPPPAGCARLPFAGEASLRPESRLAEAPVGLELNLSVAQSEQPAALAAAQLRAATVTLPPGLTIDPSAAAGARACPAGGPEGIGIPTGLDGAGRPLAPGELGEGEAAGPGGEPSLAPGHCPEASTVGTAEAASPLLARPLQGRVYLGAPGCGGAFQPACTGADAADGNLLRVYVELGGRGNEHYGGGEGGQGVVFKLEGRLRASPATGQLTLQIANAPQLPLSDLKIDLFGGSAALLDNPATCTGASTSAELEPWSSPYSADIAASAPYPVSGCQAPVPFAPRLRAGSAGVQAGSFTSFAFALARAPREQNVARLQLHAPAGVSAMLAGVAQCSDAAASQDQCPAAARIGSSAVAVGGGAQPLSLPGDVYLTGPYEGAPFGLAILTQAQAGPLDLGAVAIRARLDIDPHTAALAITTDPLPQILLGVPLRLRALELDIDRPGFVLNPTNCRGQQVLADVAGAQGALASPSNRFGIAGCRALGFAPRLAASTSARTSIAGGAALDIRLVQAAGPGSGQANMARLRIALPRSLPTRLTALQSACPARIFAADAAGCPVASIVGIARASTPLLAGRLAGPVYLVAHGRNAFPAPVVVLQGHGLRLDLTGSAAVERGGRTAIAFDALPDMPLRSVELYFPRGPHSALAAAGALCPRAAARRGPGVPSLPLPVELAAQNGIVLHRSGKIAVLGCPAASRHRGL